MAAFAERLAGVGVDYLKPHTNEHKSAGAFLLSGNMASWHLAAAMLLIVATGKCNWILPNIYKLVLMDTFIKVGYTLLKESLFKRFTALIINTIKAHTIISVKLQFYWKVNVLLFMQESKTLNSNKRKVDTKDDVLPFVFLNYFSDQITKIAFIKYNSQFAYLLSKKWLQG